VSDAADAVAEGGPTCPRCAAELAPPARFCVACGHQVDAAAAGNEAAAASDADAAASDPHSAAASEHAAASDPAPAPATPVPASATQTPSSSQAPVFDMTPPPASGRGASRRCTSCGVVNVRSRELCRSCGLDLDPDDRTAVPPRPPVAPGQRTRPGRHRRRPRWWVGLIALLLAVPAVTVAVLVVAELGPFAPPQAGPLEPVDFPAEEYPGEPEVLMLSDVATLTTAAPVGDRVFAAQGMVDGDPTSAWRNEPAELPARVPEIIDLVLQRPAWVSAVLVSNGDHHDLAAYEEVGRIERAILVLDGEVRIAATLRDLGRQRQLLELERPVLSTALRLEVIEVIAGEATPGVALSSVELRGYPASPQDAELAQQRAARRPATGSVMIDAPGNLPAGLPGARATQGS